METQDKSLIEYFVEEKLLSARFILAVLASIAFIMGKLDSAIFGIIVGFYFGNHQVTSIVNKALTGIRRI